MNLEALVNLAGETAALTAGGLLIGMAFGGFAQVSKFCLRSAVIEFSQGLLGSKIAIWLLTFSAAVVATQAAIGFGLLDVAEARQLAARGSLSGSLVGAALFGWPTRLAPAGGMLMIGGWVAWALLQFSREH